MTTDRDLGRRLLTGLADRLAVVLLHREEGLTGNAPLSDLDCAVAPEQRREAVGAAIEVARGLGTVLVAVWPYDTCGLALFFATPDLRRSVHLDLLADEHGLGKYGLRTGPLSRDAHAGTGPWLRPAPTDEGLYLVSKRILKGETDRAEDAAQRLRDLPGTARRAESLLAPHARARIAPTVGLHPPPAAQRWQSLALRAAAESRRRVRRVAAPIGAWLHLVAGPRSAATSDAVLGVDALAAPLRWAGTAPEGMLATQPLLAARWTHGAVLTCGPEPRTGATRNLRVADDPEATRAAVLDVLARHARRRLAAVDG